MFSLGASAELREANAARDRCEWIDAAKAYQAYLAKKPKRGHIWVQLGNSLKEAGEYAKALEAYSKAQQLLPENADLHVQLGHLARLDERYGDAVKAYTRAAELDPRSSHAAEGLRKLGRSTLVRPDRDRKLNAIEARACRDLVTSSSAVLKDFIDRLPSALADDDKFLIPKMMHFVFGFKEKGDLPYYGAMAIRSALHFNPGWRAFYYTMHLPEGPNWDTVKDQVEVILLENFSHFGRSRLYHYAHKADVVRMLVLNKIGGAYLDIDSITQRSFEALRGNEFVMGVQAAGPDSSSGLCNAIMFGKPGAKFSTRWLGEYDYFRSKGRDELWDYHSVKLPVQLAARNPEEITVLDYRALFYPLWGNIQKALFSETSGMYLDDFAPAYCFHLWNGATGEWLESIDRDFVRRSKSIYASIARQVEGISASDTTSVV